MAYKITAYSKKKAKTLGVTIKKSKVKNKKIAVFKNNKKVADIGDDRYNDYPTYIKKKGKAYADKRRTLYKIRHEKTRKKKGSKSYYSDNILW